MMTSACTLLAIGAYFLWRRQARWGWAAVLAALAIGVVIFMGDVAFASTLGVQL